MAIRLTREQFDQMLRQAYAEAPYECCGVLLGRGEVVEQVFPGRNVDKDARIRYTMHSDDLLYIDRLQREREWDLVGIYHSHPATQAYPSKTDRDRAMYPDSRYIIVSLADHGNPQVRAFRIVEQTDGQGVPVKDGDGQTMKVVTEEELVVT